MPPTQDTRTNRLTVPDGITAAPLVFRSMTAFERISSPFEFRILAATEQPIAKADDLLGRPCHVACHGDNGPIRHFHGTCAQVTFVGTDVGGALLYQLILRPDFWMMSRNRDCRIYQNKEVRDILSELLQRGRAKTDFKLEGTYAKRIYCVQYRESDFAFLSRLMEEEGIFYFFKHDESGHKMIIADKKSVHAEVSGYGEVPFFPPTERGSRERDHLDEWSPQYNVAAANYKSSDFDFTGPNTVAPVIEEKRTGAEAYSGDSMNVVDYPGDFIYSEDASHVDEAKQRAELRLEAERALRVVATASGNALGLAAGAKFSLTGHPVDKENAAYVIVETRHRLENDAYHSGGAVAGRDRVDIVAIPEATQFRKPLETPRPRIVGTQTALVTGPAGEEIETDQYGRIRVVFHWDTHGRDTKPTSCWIRVAQISAGKNWGAMFIPRIGQEVLVEFIDGNPDRPIVTGVVYNKDQTSPLSLPGEKTMSTIKTNSSKGGGGFNQIRFEDKKGSEELFIQAQKDMKTDILNNEAHTVTKNRVVKITQGNHEETLEQGNQSVKLSMGNQTVKLDAGKQATEAMQSIEFTVGGNSIKIDQTGITIKGIQVKIEGSAMFEVKSGALGQIDGGAMLIAKGAITLIN